MSTPVVPRPPEFEPFSCETIVFRAAKSQSYFSEDKTKAAPPAFYRRPLTAEYPDYNGLSVDTSQENIKANITRKFYGFISLHVGRVRDLGLDVKRDDQTHGNICGNTIDLPFRDETDLEIIAACEAIAIQLADISKAIFERIPELAKR